MLPHWEMTVRLLVAAALGSVIGLERERLSWTAGLRTHMLVAVGSALIMIVSAYGFTDALRNDHTVLDPSRVAAHIEEIRIRLSPIAPREVAQIIVQMQAVPGVRTVREQQDG
jgi:MgtC family